MFKTVILLLLFSFNTNASFKVFSHKNNRTTKKPVIQKSVFKRTVKSMGAEFSYLADKFDEELLTYAGWNDPTFDQALARRWDSAQILVYRGMAHRREINRDALVLIICHELGHLYGGKPLKNTRDFIAAEGQADYFATQTCLRQALKFFDSKDIESRALNAIKAVGRFLANNWGHTHPHENTPDLSQVNETYLDHPTPQCRFDTLMAGLKGGQRPACWFAKESFRE